MDNNRYSRQITFPGIGKEGQEKLAAARVAVIGAGALGSVIAEELCRAGLGYILLADRDYVDITNLHRQFLYDEEDVRLEKPKAEAASDHLRQINSEVTIEPYIADVDSSNIEELVKGVDLIIDGTDNFEVRALINEACHKHKKPWIYGAGLGAHGATMNIFPDGATRPDGSPLPQGGPCLRCFIRDIPAPGSYPTCSTAGVISMTTATVASIECAEAIKIITGSKDVSARYLDIDLWANAFEYVSILRDEECPVCGSNNSENPQYEMLGRVSGAYTNAVCGQDAYQVVPAGKAVIDFDDMAAKLRKAGAVRTERFSLHFEGDGVSFVLFKDGRAIIRGAKDEHAAKSIYSEYIGL
jgi:adenylyltransferase/sulfurtransferase